jgi:acetyl-CoA carboxylase biotin carboxyl carrier protein
MLCEEIDTVREDESVDVNQIRELIKVVEASDINEVVVEENGAIVTVRKGGYHLAQPAASAPAAAAPAMALAEQDGRPASWKEVRAMMVGTFYAAPSPGSDPFVEVGDLVEIGNPVCILEAMKLMNEIEMPETGIIREVAAVDASAVDYGAVLFYYEPTE